MSDSKNIKFTVPEVVSMFERDILTQEDYDFIISHTNTSYFIEGNKLKTLLFKRAVKTDIAFIDYLNFTFQDSTINSLNPDIDITLPYDLIIELSRQLNIIFGVSITSVRQTGANFYERSYEIGDKYGLVCHGGQNNTLLVSFNGEAFKHFNDGWQNRLYTFLYNDAVLPRITRIDLAHDDFNPEFFTVDNMLLEYKKGTFNNGNRHPSVAQAGNWINPDSKGRTLYIGSRTNGLYCRVYEKGLQLTSAEFPNWVRVEVEVKAVDRIIPFETILEPHNFLSGCYPVLNRLTNQQSKIETIKNEIKSDINHRIKWGKRQQGGLIKLLEELEYTNDEIINVLKSEKLPRKFKQRFIKTDLTPIQESRDSDLVDQRAQILNDESET